jgi:hypothetical protein
LPISAKTCPQEVVVVGVQILLVGEGVVVPYQHQHQVAVAVEAVVLSLRACCSLLLLREASRVFALVC